MLMLMLMYSSLNSIYHILGYPNAMGLGTNSFLIAESDERKKEEKKTSIFNDTVILGVKILKSENILLWKVAFGYPRIANPSKGNYLHRMIKIKNIYYKKVKNMFLKYIQTV